MDTPFGLAQALHEFCARHRDNMQQLQRAFEAHNGAKPSRAAKNILDPSRFQPRVQAEALRLINYSVSSALMQCLVSAADDEFAPPGGMQLSIDPKGYPLLFKDFDPLTVWQALERQFGDGKGCNQTYTIVAQHLRRTLGPALESATAGQDLKFSCPLRSSRGANFKVARVTRQQPILERLLVYLNVFVMWTGGTDMNVPAILKSLLAAAAKEATRSHEVPDVLDCQRTDALIAFRLAAALAERLPAFISLYAEPK